MAKAYTGDYIALCDSWTSAGWLTRTRIRMALARGKYRCARQRPERFIVCLLFALDGFLN